MSCNDMRDKGSKMSAAASEEKKTRVLRLLNRRRL